MTVVLGDGLHFLSGAHLGGVSCVPSLTGNVWIDPTCLPYGEWVSITYPSSAPSGRIVAIDTGANGYILQTGGRGITIPRGETVQLYRHTVPRFTIDGGVPRETSFTARQRRILLIGQSLGSGWQYTSAPHAFMARMAVLGSTDKFRFYHACTGGSACLPAYASTSKPNNWWHDAGPDWTQGPLFAAALDLVQGLPATEKPTDVLWIQGEQDSGMFSHGNPCPSEGEIDAFREAYGWGVYKVLDLLRWGIDPSDRYSIPAYVQRLGPRASGERPGMVAVRDAQEWLVSRPGRNIRWGAQPPMDLPLSDDVHPTDAGFAILGGLTADAMI